MFDNDHDDGDNILNSPLTERTNNKIEGMKIVMGNDGFHSFVTKKQHDWVIVFYAVLTGSISTM